MLDRLYYYFISMLREVRLDEVASVAFVFVRCRLLGVRNTSDVH